MSLLFRMRKRRKKPAFTGLIAYLVWFKMDKQQEEEKMAAQKEEEAAIRSLQRLGNATTDEARQKQYEEVVAKQVAEQEAMKEAQQEELQLANKRRCLGLTSGVESLG